MTSTHLVISQPLEPGIITNPEQDDTVMPGEPQEGALQGRSGEHGSDDSSVLTPETPSAPGNLADENESPPLEPVEVKI